MMSSSKSDAIIKDSKLRFTEGHTTKEDERLLKELAKAIEGISIESYNTSPWHILGTSLTGIAALVSAQSHAATHLPHIIYPAGVNCPKIGSDYHDNVDIDGMPRKPGHTGIDIVAELDYPIIAPADGTVVITGHRETSGNRIVIYHGEDADGMHVFTFYGHMNSIEVKEEQKIKRAQRIGTIGNTGSNMPRSRAPHLHFEVLVSNSGSYSIRDGLVYYRSRRQLVSPHEYWLRESEASGLEDKIIITQFVDGKVYPPKPIRFTYPVSCR